MSTFWRHAAISICGVLTSIATAVIIATIESITGFNLFTFSMWVVVPVGAGLCGFAAASGYYFAAKILHQRPSKTLLLQMVVIAAFSQVLIYWFEYTALKIDGTFVSSMVPFTKYLDISLTNSHMKIGRAMQVDTGELGSLGYWLAVINFVGFLLGGVFMYLTLQGQPACDDCIKYMKTAAKKTDVFKDAVAFGEYFEREFDHPVDSVDFAAHVGAKYSAEKPQKGAVNLEASVFACPECGSQAVIEKVKVHNGSEWKDVHAATRRTSMPAGVDVSPVYQNGAMARVMQQANLAKVAIASAA